MEFVIKDRSTLDQIRTDKSLKQQIRKIKIEIGSEDDLSGFERKLNRHYFACGCETGEFTVIITALVGLVFWQTGLLPQMWIWWKILIALFLSALLGKIVGLLLSYLKVKQLLKELDNLIAEV